MPVGPEALGGEAGDGEFGEEFVLEAAAREQHALASSAPRDLDDSGGEGLVEMGGDFRNGSSLCHIVEKRCHHGTPVEGVA